MSFDGEEKHGSNFDLSKMNGLRSDYIEKNGKLYLEEIKLLVLPCEHFSKLSNIEIGDSFIVQWRSFEIRRPSDQVHVFCCHF